MQKRTIGSVGVVSFALLAGGCASHADSEPVTGECAAALASAQGVSLQGLSVQGLSNQGLSVQGLSVQGLSVQGLSVQGLSVQGLSPQGFSAQGFSAQGISAQGLQAQGLQAQGLQAQGLQAQGIQAQGLTYQGVGLQGIALRGVTPEQADRWVAGVEPTIAADKVVFIGVERGVLSGLSATGTSLRHDDLVGLLLPFQSHEGETLWIEVTAVAMHPDAESLPVYALAFEGESLCEDPIGGVFVPGVWDETGARHDSITVGGRTVSATFSCPSGVIEKCVVWGYAPWSVGAETHQTCTRMARADYCGDGVPHTQNGTTIDMFDISGIQTPVADDGLSFEAGWGEDGAVCVREPRYVDQTTTGAVILPSCWADKPHCETFAEAVDLGAELGNDSAHLTRMNHCGL